jgi:site-specific recombinase XerC
MRGPDLTDIRLVWRAASTGDGPRPRRDRAILALLFDLGLWRSELCGIDLADVEPGPLPEMRAGRLVSRRSIGVRRDDLAAADRP